MLESIPLQGITRRVRRVERGGYFDQMEPRRALTTGLALCVLIVGSSAAAADAGPSAFKMKKYATSASLSSRFPAFSGRVSSSFAPCRKQRKVELFEKLSDGGHRRLGKDRSDSSGRWAIELRKVESGAYYVRVKPRLKRGGASPLVCKTGRSETVIVN